MKATKTWVLIFLLLIPVILFGTDALAMLRETESNNTFSQANTFQLNGEEFAGQLYSSSDVDVFKFNVSTPGVLSFSIKPENILSDGGVTRVTIKDSSSTILASKELLNYSTGINLMANVAISGYYYLIVDKMPGYAVSNKDYQITPNLVLPGPGTVVVNPEPNSINAPWTLTGPNGYSQTGIGDQTLTNITPGDYTLTWGHVADFIKPLQSTQTLASSGTITFMGTYKPKIPSLPWLMLLLGD